MKVAEKLEARRLRSEKGLSVREIAARVGVTQSTVSVWVRDIELTAEQRASLIQQGKHASVKSAAINRVRGVVRRAAQQEVGRIVARQRAPLHMAGCCLYWAEGSKSKNAAIICNSDPSLLKLFVSFLRETFALEDDAIAVTCYIYPDHASQQEAMEAYWLSELGLPPRCMRNSVLNRISRSSRGARHRTLPYGTCRVAVHRTDVVQHIYGAIQEYGQFQNTDWLV